MNRRRRPAHWSVPRVSGACRHKQSDGAGLQIYLVWVWNSEPLRTNGSEMVAQVFRQMEPGGELAAAQVRHLVENAA